MNASRPPFSLGLRSIALAGAGLMVSACTSVPFTDTRIDPNSPVAADVARLTRQPAKTPRFSDIPPVPKDVRPPAEYGRNAQAITAAGQALVAATEPSTWTLQDSTTFADRGRRDVGPDIPPVQPGESEAFARALRERATPPPPR